MPLTQKPLNHVRALVTLLGSLGFQELHKRTIQLIFVLYPEPMGIILYISSCMRNYETHSVSLIQTEERLLGWFWLGVSFAALLHIAFVSCATERTHVI